MVSIAIFMMRNLLLKQQNIKDPPLYYGGSFLYNEYIKDKKGWIRSWMLLKEENRLLQD